MRSLNEYHWFGLRWTKSKILYNQAMRTVLEDGDSITQPMFFAHDLQYRGVVVYSGDNVVIENCIGVSMKSAMRSAKFVKLIRDEHGI